MGNFLATESLPPMILSIAIGVPSFILYISLVYLLVRNWKQFNSAFYRLFLIRASVNIISYIGSYVGIRFGRLGLFYSIYIHLPNWVIATLWFSYYYGYQVENTSTFFILLNRFTSIAIPLRHEKVWSRYFPLSIILIFAAPLPITWQIFTREYIVVIDDGRTVANATFSFDYVRKPGVVYIDDSDYSAASAVIFLVLCVVLNSATALLYRFRIKPSNSGQVERQNMEMEMRLTIYALVTFLAQLLMAIFMIIIYITVVVPNLDTLFFTCFNQLPWIADSCTIVLPSWMMVWASKTIRDMTKEMWGLKCCSGSDNRVIPITGTSPAGNGNVN